MISHVYVSKLTKFIVPYTPPQTDFMHLNFFFYVCYGILKLQYNCIVKKIFMCFIIIYN